MLKKILPFLGGLLILASCSKQKPSSSPILDEIDHFQIDTIDTTNKEPMGSESLDQILRHYPELYRSAEKSRKAYRKWLAMEQQMILTAFVGTNAERSRLAERHADKLLRRLELHDVTHFLEASLLGPGSNAEPQWTDHQPASDSYLQLLARVKPALEADADHAATDDVKSSIGRARRAYNAYIEQLHKTCQALPQEFRADFAQAASHSIRLHQIDLACLYLPYTLSERSPLSDDATDEQIASFSAPMPQWFED